ncbi:hypothetical protein HD554DRAFT_2058285, partial [Boletus coccyginus]
CTSSVPDEAIDCYELSYEAADGKKQKTSMESFDDTGLMALICRYDIPLFFANVDTLGEQQKYALALIIHLFSLLPPHATVVIFYDVGCVLDHMLSLYNIYPEEIVQCLRFATTAMHAYGHKWACQLVYNPCLNYQCRIWLIDRQLTAVGNAPARLKKELDAVLALQADIEMTDCAIHSARVAIQKGVLSEDTASALDSLEQSHDHLLMKVDALYASLNVGEKFPKLAGIQLDFINIRKCAIGSFFKWDKLNQAIGGAQQALGTKLHQQTRKAISKQQPVLMSTICKFNSYCEQLEELHDPAWSIPLPTPLLTKLNNLQNNQFLMEDVWITLSEGQILHWLEDQIVHDIEQAMHTPENEIFYFNTQTSEATTLALDLSGGSPQVSLLWVKPTMAEVPKVASEAADLNVESEATLLDYLMDIPIGVADEEEAVRRPMIPVEIRVRPPQDEFPGLTFGPHELVMLADPTAQLNDWCINGYIPLLLSVIQLVHVPQFTVLSTYELPHIQVTSQTRFWTKEHWIIPIHHPAPENHWVLCIADFSCRELWLFDSLAQQKLWESVVLDVMRLITRLLTIVKRKHPTDIQLDYRPWVAYPTTSLPRQTNSYDYGVWVLATVAAVIQGFDATGLKEVEIADFRRYLHYLVLELSTLL